VQKQQKPRGEWILKSEWRLKGTEKGLFHPANPSIIQACRTFIHSIGLGATNLTRGM